MVELVQKVTDGDRVALVFGDRVVSYRELAGRVAVAARELIGLGVGPDVAVAVCLDRSVELVVAIQAVVAAGGHYVPIAVDSPTDRIRYMLDTAGARCVLVRAGSVPAGLDGLEDRITLVEVDAGRPVDWSVAAVTDRDRLAPLLPDHAAYTLFTSGSTGRPKGVTVSHRALANRLVWMAERYGLGGGDVFVQKTPVTFDVSVWELFLPFVLGSRLVIAAPGRHGDAEYLSGLLCEHAVTVVHFVPSMLSAFVDSVGAGLALLRDLRTVFTSGEALTTRPAQAVLDALPVVRVVNLYGPTEAAVDVTAHVVTSGEVDIPIGRPVSNTATLVLDPRLNLVPSGVPGELYLGGVQLARGYAGREDLTAERFVADPFGDPGSRLYRTGDLVRWNAMGELEYLGRTDFQVKLRGQRLELGEVESVIAAVPGVVHAAAAVVDGPGGSQHLVGYLAPATVSLDVVTSTVAAALPAYMVPSVWVVLEDIALNSAGKIDRRALAAPDFGQRDEAYAAPRGPLEEQLAATVAALLGVEQVSVTESFFALGGDSIMSIQLASAMRAAGHGLSPRQIFEHKTVRAMAQAIAEAETVLPELAEPAGGGVGAVVLPPVVAWMLEFSDSPDDFADFNQSATLAAPSGITAAEVGELMSVVVEHHPMLSAVLDRVGGEWTLTAGGPFDAGSSVSASTSAHRAGTDGFDADLTAAHAVVAARLDPAAGALVQAEVVTDAEGVSRVVIAIHHLGVDAVSWSTIVEDLITLWAQRSAGHQMQLRAATTSQRAWSQALVERLPEHAGEVGYWLDRLPAIPTDFGARPDRSRDRAGTARTVVTRVGPAVTESVLSAIPEAFGGNVNDALLGALARAVRGWQEARGIVDDAPVSVLIEGHGRYEEVLESGADPVRVDLSRSVGWFTSLAPVNLDPGADVVHAVKVAKEERLSQPASGIGFGWLRYHGASVEVASGGDVAELASRPLPSILFNYLGAGGRSATETESLPFAGTDGPAYSASPDGAMVAQAALTVNVGVANIAGQRELVASLIAPAALLTDDDLADLGDRWNAELTDIVTVVASGADVGLSPSDVPGSGVTQHDLDVLAQRFPGADVWPLSPLQGGLYFQAELASSITDAVDVYVAQGVLELGAGVDADRLRVAGQRLVDAHRVLRSGFVTAPSGVPVSVVLPEAVLPWTEIDLGQVDPQTRAVRLREIADGQCVESFDLAAPPLLRFVLVRHGETSSLVVTNHHLILDGWSMPLVMADVLALYATGATFTSQASGGVEGDFGDFLRLIAARGEHAGLEAWRKVLAPVEGPTLVASAVAEASAEALPRDVETVLDAGLVAGLEAVAREHGATLAMVLQLAWAVLLSRLTGNRVVTFGETVSGRPADLDGVDSMIGLFINTLPAVVDVDPGATVGQVLEKLQADKVSVLDYQHLSLSDIQGCAPVPMGFDTLVVHESYPVDADSLSSADASVPGGLTITDTWFRDMTHYPLNMATGPVGDGSVFLRLKYLPAVFDAEQVAVYAEILRSILRTFAQAPNTVTVDIDLGQTSSPAPDTGWPRPTELAVPSDTVADLLRGRVAMSPDADALIFAGRTMSYRELGARASQLARELIGAGIGPDRTVALAVPRSLEMALAIHAVLLSGGGYMPIDVAAPRNRVDHMMEVEAPDVLLVAASSSGSAAVAAAHTRGIRVIEVDASVALDVSTPALLEPYERSAQVRPENAVYTIFTSGSTGRPKGVTVSHRSLRTQLVADMANVDFDAAEVFVQILEYTFDPSVLDFLRPLVCGGSLVLLPAGGHRDPVVIGEAIAVSEVTTVVTVQSMLAVWADIFGKSDPGWIGGVRRFILGGESLPAPLVDEVIGLWPQVTIHNMYGPTETTIAATSLACVPGADVTIGVPMLGTYGYVLDERLRPLPPGIPGELYLGGLQVARGYAGQPALTADRFIADPFSADAGARLYRTGDRVQWRTAGDIEYLGRNDFQVKLRGQRIELGEIESVLSGAPGVVLAAVAVAQVPDGSQALVGYLEERSGETVDLDAVAAVARGALPGYMVPTVWMVVDDIRLTSAGKIDRRALPVPQIEPKAREFIAPSSAAEEVVAALFADVLGIERVGVTESFFDVGGNSLSAMRLAARVGTALDVQMSVRDVFEAPSVRELVAAVADSAPALPPITAIVPRPDRIPLSFAQQRMWFINQFDPGDATYNIPAVLRLTGVVDVDALRAAVADVVVRHEVLRTTFPSVDGMPVQVVDAADSVVDRLDWMVVPSWDELIAAVSAGFDVSVQWPLRVRLLPEGDGSYVFALVAHHIATDGESMLPLVTDVVTAYVARAAGGVPEFVPLEVQVADYAIWQHEVLGSAEDLSSVVGRQLTYWREQLAGLPDVLELPSDRIRPPVASHRGGTVGFALPAVVGEQVGAMAAGSGVTPFMVVHAALAVLLARLSATADIAIGTPVAGRGQAELDPLVGMFVNTLVLRTSVDVRRPFTDLIEHVRAVDVAAFAHADAPFETVVEVVDPVRSEAFSPLAQVVLSFDPGASIADSDVSVAGLQIAQLEPPVVPAQFDLLVTLAPAAPGSEWAGTVTYATDLFDGSSVSAMMARFVGLLEILTSEPSTVVGDAPLLRPAERDFLAGLPAPVEDTVNGGRSLVEVFGGSVVVHRAGVAVSALGVSLTYGELDERSDAVAAGLVARGVGAGDLVGVATARSVDLVVAIVGVLKAGAAYLPLDTTNPVGRLAYIVADSGVGVILTDDSVSGHELWSVIDAGVVPVDVSVLAAGVVEDFRPVGILPDSRAYVIYTSGSTGQPKGVEVTHRDVVTLMDTAAGDFTFRADDVWTMFHSYAFDFTVWELWGPLLSGARLVVVDRDVARDTEEFLRLLADEGVTVLSQTPSAFYQLIDARRRHRVDLSLRYIVFGGEALSFEQVRRWYDLFLLDRAELVNMYGITETTVHVSFRALDRDVASAGDGSYIGRPLASLAIHVLDDRLAPVPDGVPGEMYVAGGQLAQGYLARPGLTGTRFVANPFGPAGSRLYRTGDRARRVGDDIEYLGRGDSQVQLRGFRIEYGEVEAGLLAVPGVVGAAARVVEIPGRGEQLVGYLVVEAGEVVEAGMVVDVQRVQEIAGREVPAYMVPTIIEVIDVLPLTANGKLDRDALPVPELGSAEDYVAPANTVEEQLAAIVAAVMGLDRVSVTESFFALGGDSIMSIQLASAARAAGLVLSPREIFEHRTVRAMARVIAEGAVRLPMLAEPEGGPAGEVVLPPIVSWMLDLADTEQDFAEYSQQAVLVAPDGLTEEVLGELLAAVVAVHPMLSASLTRDGDRWSLISGGSFDRVGSIGVRRVDAFAGSAEFDAAVVDGYRAASGRLDPGAGQLLQVEWIIGHNGAGRVVVVVHHIGVDAVSWQALVEDLVTGWAQVAAGQPIVLRPEGTSARAWSAATAAQADSRQGELDYWMSRLPVAPTDLGAAIRRDRDRNETAVSVSFTVPAQVTEALLTVVPEVFAGNVNDALLAALARGVRSWQRARGLDDVAPVSVLLEKHGRFEEVTEFGPAPARADLSRTVGWFTTIAPMNLDPGVDAVHAVKSAKEERLAQPDSGIGFGILRYQAATELRTRPLPSINFNYLGATGGGSAEPVAEVIGFTRAADAPSLLGAVSNRMVAAAELDILAGTRATADGRELWATIMFPEALFEMADIDELAGYWRAELTEIAAVVASGTAVGLSPSDVPGSGVTQHDLDVLAQRFPGAEVWPLSPLQGGLFFQAELASQIDGAVDVYVAQGVLELGAGVDTDRLRGAGQRLVDAHRVLRSGFVTAPSGVPVSVVLPEAVLPWTEIDLGQVDPQTRAVRLREIADGQCAESFDLAAPPLLRFVLVRHGETSSLVVTNHHLILDGWSTPLVMADVLALYATGATFTSQASGGVETDFGDFLTLIAGRDKHAGLEAWRRVLAPVEGPTLVATAPAEASVEAMPRDFETVLDAGLVAGLEAVAREHGATLAMVLQLAWAVLLSRLTGNRVVTFGETVSGRPTDLDGVDSMIGLFINTLPAVVDVDPGATVGQVLEKLQADKVSVLDYQHLSLSDIQDCTPVPMGFDTLMVHESYPVDADSLSSADASVPGGLTITDTWFRDMTHYPLNMITGPSAGNGLFLRLKYLPTVFDDAQVAVFSTVLHELLRTIAAAPQTRTIDIRLTGGEGSSRSRGAPVAMPAITSIGEAVAAQIARTPDAVALVSEGRQVSYREFGARVNTLARVLIAAGVGPEISVGVCLDRSVEMVVAIHAVVAAGGQYVPIDPAVPTDRLEYMTQVADVRLILAAPGDLPSALESVDVPLVVVDAAQPVDITESAVSAEERLGVLSPDSAVYTLFTSGSTGRPKGVTVSHRAVLNRLWWGLETFEWTVGDRVVLKTPFTFDVSVPELFGPLLAGATVIVARDGGHADPEYLMGLLEDSAATSVHFVPSMLSVFLDVVDHARLGRLTHLKWLFASGEALPPATVAAAHAVWPQTQIHNLFGPTEAAVEIGWADVSDAPAIVTIGSPVANSAMWVLDARLNPVPSGIPGELYLGGVQLARGYAGQPGLTAERFIADPNGEPGDRLYRTGDLVQWNTAGQIEYLGRTDFQVKLRGQRLELGEIEAVVIGAPGVVKAAVAVRTSDNGNDYLVAYVSPATVEVDQVRAAVAEALPGYMVPTVWMVLDDLALNSAGKIDRRALPAPDLAIVTTEYVAPEGGNETALAAVFADVLGAEQISVTESFFDLGGNSLSAMRVAARAGEALGVEISVRDLFEAPTVRALASAAAAMRPALAPITATDPRPEQIPLSFAQQRIWFLNRFDVAAPTYNISVVLKLTGTLNVAALRQAMVDVVARHEVLRTIYQTAAGRPFGVISPARQVEARLDWAIVESQAALEVAVTTGFDVAEQWPVRVRLWHRTADEWLLAIVLHHISADGESMGPLMTDLVSAYAARTAGCTPEFDSLDVQFADFAVWQHAVLGSSDDPASVVGAQLEYWREQLSGAPDVLELPTDRPRPAVASHHGESVAFTVPEAVGDRIAQVAREYGVTSFMVIHAALAVLLGRLATSDDISIATPVGGRGQAVLDPLIGMFVNTLVLRTRWSADVSFADALHQVKHTDLDAFAHADAPFETVVEAVDPVRTEAFGPLAQVVLAVFQGSPEPPAVDVGDLRVEPMSPPEVSAQYDLHVNVGMRSGGDWAAQIVYATDLFDEATIEVLADRFVRVMDAVTTDPAVAVGDVELLTRAERDQLMALPAPVAPEVASDTLVDLFARAAAEYRDATAVSAFGRSVSYSELDARSSAVAAGLVAAGVGPGDLVGLATARSVDLVAAILGVMKAGAAYLPLDVTNPVDRLRHIVADSGVRVALTDASTAGHELWSVVGPDVQVQDVDRLASANTAAVFTAVRVPAQSRAYVIYTSGSTGLPKGVEVTHEDVAALMAACAREFDFRNDDVWTLFHSYAFDFSVWELWGPLLSGARVVIVDRDLARDMDGFVDLLAAERVTVLSLTPSAFYQLSEARRRRDPELALRYVVFGGEELGFEHVRRWFDENPDDVAQLVNMYGITETTVHVSFRAIDRELATAADPSYIGRPLTSLSLHILDERLRPVPAGVVGEMYVAGAQLAQGYLDRRGLTATRFVADPFTRDGAGSRLYRTGDLARRIDDDIEYLGRSDGQVQLRGFRIEFGEVEAALLGVPGVIGSAARVVKDAHRGDLLVGYVVPDTGVHLEAQDVRDAAGASVPRYMVPDLVMMVERLPLTANGKLDRAALPAPDFVGTVAEYVGPQGDNEAMIAVVFAEILGVERVSVTESFFDLGGNSLSAMRLAARAGEALNTEVSIRDVFDAPTVRALAAATAGRGDAMMPLARAVPRPASIPLSFAQIRMWFINQFEPMQPTYNIPISFRLTGALDLGALRAAVLDVVTRHEVLRTTFPAIDGQPEQVVQSIQWAQQTFDWDVAASGDDMIEAASRGFDVTRQAGFRIRVLQERPGEWIVLAVLHHIIGDGESMSPLLNDLVIAYVARAAGEAPEFEPLELQFADYAVWQHAALGDPKSADSVAGRQLAYWKRQLDGLPDVLDLPADRPRPLVASQAGASESFEIPQAITERIDDVAARWGVTRFMVLHAALAVLLARLSATDDIAVATPIAGRGNRLLDPLVGMFVNTLVLRTKVTTLMPFSEFLEQVREVDLEAFATADVPFEAIVDALTPVRSQAFAPLAQVLFTLDNAVPQIDGQHQVQVGELAMSPMPLPVVSAQGDLSVRVGVVPDGNWTGVIVFATDLFDVATMAAFGRRFVNVLNELTADPERPLGLASILDHGELDQVTAWSIGPGMAVATGTVTEASAILRALADGVGDTGK